MNNKRLSRFYGHNHGECRKCGKHHGSASGNKNLGNMRYFLGKKLTPEHVLHLRLSHLGYTPSEEAKKNMSLARMGKKNHFFGKKHTEEAKKAIRVARLKQTFPLKDSIPEKTTQEILSLNSIDFLKHKVIKIAERYYQIDIFIEPNICILINGYYWHFCPKCYANKIPNEAQFKNKLSDDMVYPNLVKLGYKVIIIWEHDIKDKITQLPVNKSKTELILRKYEIIQ